MPEITRDPVTGQIIKTKLTSEEASAMGKARAAKAKNKPEEKEELAIELGFASYDEVPQSAKLLLDQAVSGRSGSFSAISAILKMKGTDDLSKKKKLSDDEACPYCGATPDVRAINEFLAKPKKIAAFLKALNELDE